MNNNNNIFAVRLLVVAILIIGALVLVGCAGTRDDGVIRIGLTIDESNPIAGEAASRALAQALSDFIGMPVEPVLDISYMAGIEAMRGGHIDIKLVSAFNYIRTSSVVDVEMLVSLPMTPTVINNTAFVVSASRDDLNALADLRGQRIAFVSAVSTTGFIFPQYHLVSELGLNPGRIAHSGYFFDTVTFSGGHEASIIGVGFGDFDAAAVGGMFIQNMHDRGIINENDFRVIASTPEVPPPSYIIRSDIDDALIAQIREFFLSFDDPAYFAENWGDGNLRFTAPDIEGYAYVRSMVETLGLE